jgi:hypothetical protein
MEQKVSVTPMGTQKSNILSPTSAEATITPASTTAAETTTICDVPSASSGITKAALTTDTTTIDSTTTTTEAPSPPPPMFRILAGGGPLFMSPVLSNRVKSGFLPFWPIQGFATGYFTVHPQSGHLLLDNKLPICTYFVSRGAKLEICPDSLSQQEAIITCQQPVNKAALKCENSCCVAAT